MNENQSKSMQSFCPSMSLTSLPFTSMRCDENWKFTLAIFVAFCRQWNMSISIMPGDRPRPSLPPPQAIETSQRIHLVLVRTFLGSQKSISTVRQMCQFYIYKSASITLFLKLLYRQCRGDWASETDTQCQAKVITVVSGVRRLSTVVRPEAQNMEIFEFILNQVKRRRRANNEEKKGGMELTSIKLKRQFKIYNSG